MLSYLRVENFAVVKRVEINFSEGLNILTGETGTGKSIIVDSISLLFKKNINPSFIRDKNEKLTVEAFFNINDKEFSLRREFSKSKSISFIDGNAVPFSRLKKKAENLVNIYGQNEHLFLLNPNNHVKILDQFSKLNSKTEELKEIVLKINSILKNKKKLEIEKENSDEKLDYINFQINEFDTLGFNDKEIDDIENKYKILTSSEEIINKIKKIIDDFYESENSAYSLLSRNFDEIQYLSNIYSEISEYKEEIERISEMISDFSNILIQKRDEIDFDMQESSLIEEKYSLLSRLKVKHKTDYEGLKKKYQELINERDKLINIDHKLNDINKELSDWFEKYKKINSEIRRIRINKSKTFSKIIEKELKKLEMNNARFKVKIVEKEPDINNLSERGSDETEFLFSSNPGIECGKIKDIASGGELSRLMLVIKSITGDNINDITFIFDEIDTGIGGKTAEFVGEKLKSISKSNQVICISHLPQIASFADNHFLIEKYFKDNQTFTKIKELNNSARIKEIARLMAGSAVNESVLSAAENLLNKNKK